MTINGLQHAVGRGRAAWAAVLAILGLMSGIPTARATALTRDQVIADLVYANRILAAHGILDGFGHVSARSPDNPDHFFLARSLAPAQVTAKDILEFNLNGEPVTPTTQRLYVERFIHAGAYRARRDVGAVIHSHSPEILAFSITRAQLRAAIHDAAFLGTGVPVFDADSDGANGSLLIRNMAQANALAAALGENAVVLIRGHGDVIVGRDVSEVVTHAIYVDKNAKVQKEAALLGGPVSFITPVEIAERARLLAAYTEGRDWNLLKAEVGAIDPTAHMR